MKRGPGYLVLAVLVDRSLPASGESGLRYQHPGPEASTTPPANLDTNARRRVLVDVVWLCPPKITRPLVARPRGSGLSATTAADSKHKPSLRCLQLCLRVQVAQVQRQSHASIERDSGSTPTATATLSPASQDEVGVYSTQSSRGTARWGCSPPQASPRSRQKIIGKQRCQPQPSDQRLSTDDCLLCMAPNRKMTS
ncbi:hypothetical protein TgHK011_002820 [Trichoderma gracile]|nr:hypothetical protein TgHK011_002820 [Trichoderma gracile]